MFAFTPKTDEEINALRNRHLLPEGNYSFIVKDVTPSTSKSGNPMLEVIAIVIDTDASERNIKDFLMTNETMIFKLKHFCEAIGLEKEYHEGKLDPAKCIGRTGKCRIGIQKGQMKPDGSGFYNDRNVIKDYITIKEVKVEVEAKAELKVDKELNDDIPF